MSPTIRKKNKSEPVIKIKKLVVFPEFGSRKFQGKKRPRKKINFMVNEDLIEAMNFFVENGDRSNFANGALEEALRDIARKRAMDAMDEIRKTAKIRMTDEEIRKARDYGRE